MNRFDVVIVGARCAGSPLALLLARAGLRVCVLDRAHFPSDTASTHLLQPRGVDVLDRLGVLPAVLAAGAAPVDGISLVFDDVTIEADGNGEGNPGVCVRRLILDDLLVQAAQDAGADVRTRTGVTGLLRDRGRVTGVETSTGPIFATVVVGADGRHSTVARAVGAAEYHVSAPGRLLTWAYYEGVSERGSRLKIGRRGDLAFLAAPTDNELFMVGVAPAMSEKDRFLRERGAYFDVALQQFPEVAVELAGARRVGPVRTVPDWYGYFRTAAGPGWVLTGDAGHFKDPTPGQGISDALQHAEELADALIGSIDSERELDTALAEFWRRRDDDCYDMYWFAADMGAAGPLSPLIRAVMRDIANDRRASADLLAVLNRQLRPADLFGADRMAKAFVRSVAAAPRQLPALARELVATGRTEIRRRAQRGSAGGSSSEAASSRCIQATSCQRPFFQPIRR